MIVNWIAAHAWAEVWALAWHFGIIGLVLICALLWAWFAPFFKKTALWVALGAAIIFFTAGMYTRLGANYVYAKWNIDAAGTTQQAIDARRNAENQFPVGPDVAHARVLRGDPWDRDQIKPKASSTPAVRTPGNVFGVKRHR